MLAELADLARLIPDGVLVLSAHGTILLGNARAEELLAPDGKSGSLECRPLGELVAEPADQLAAYLGDCAGSHEPLLGSLSLRARDGGAVHLRCWGARLCGDSSAVLLRLQSSDDANTAFALLNRTYGALAREQKARAAAERAGARLGQLQTLTAALSRARTVAEIVGAALAHGPPALGTASAVIYLLDASGTELRLVGHAGVSAILDRIPRALPLDGPQLIATAARKSEPLWLDEAAAQRVRRSCGAAMVESGILAVAALPLRAGERTLGAMSLVFREPRRLTDEEWSFARITADQCAQALDRALLYEEATKARADAELESRAKDEFLATLSHELRTPLTAILGWASILRTRAPEPTALDRPLGVIERNARALGRLIEDILDVSRIMAHKLRLQARPVDAAAVVRAAADVVRPAAEQKGLALTIAVDDDAGAVSADPERLQQIAVNLLTNAVKFTPRGGRVEVRLALDDDRVRLVVSDSGQGIAPEFLPHVFERFRQADGSRSRSHGGLGLGLAIVKHLVELQEGTITAESEGLGRGATFTVTFPALAGAAGERSSTAPAEASADNQLEGVRVVIVDDEPDARELVMAILQGQGARVTPAASAIEALYALELDPPDVLVSDIGMPGEDGYELLQRVRAGARGAARRVPALALTAYAGAHDARMAELSGFQMHLPKPVVPAQLIAAVARLAGRAAR